MIYKTGKAAICPRFDFSLPLIQQSERCDYECRLACRILGSVFHNSRDPKRNWVQSLKTFSKKRSSRLDGLQLDSSAE